jgi:hypothetical protein
MVPDEGAEYDERDGEPPPDKPAVVGEQRQDDGERKDREACMAHARLAGAQRVVRGAAVAQARAILVARRGGHKPFSLPSLGAPSPANVAAAVPRRRRATIDGEDCSSTYFAS